MSAADEIIAAIADAEQRGCVAFWCVVPVSPEFLRDAIGAPLVVAEAAAKDIEASVKSYMSKHGIEQ